MSEENHTNLPPFPQELPDEGNKSEHGDTTDAPLHGEGEVQPAVEKPRRGRPPSATPKSPGGAAGETGKPEVNRVVKLLEKNPLGMTLPEMAGGTRQIKRIKTMRPQLAEAIRSGLVMPVSQRAGHTVYRLVKHIANR